MKIKATLLFFFLSIFLQLSSQDRISTEDYIETYKDVAVKKMKEFNIPASITLAQGILESGSGNSRLAKIANNHFGIKCHKGWTGKTFIMDDDAKNECFRKYKDPADSYRDHSEFLTQRGRYSFLFEYKITDYKSWANGLKKAGYATNPKYPQLLIGIIERYDLSQFDKGGKPRKKEKGTPVEAVATATLSTMVAGLSPVTTSYLGREVFENNGVRFIVIKAGDTFYGIADEFNIYSWQLFKYNEVDKKHILKIDELVYIEKKKKKADKEYKKHTVGPGETLRYISNLYGVRINSLRKRNSLPDKQYVREGQVLKLR